LTKLREWTKELVELVENVFGKKYVKPKLHSILHLHNYITQLGPLSMCDTFQMENLLSKVRRNIHSCVAPEKQGFDLLIANVAIPVLNERCKQLFPHLFKTASSAIDMFLNIASAEQEWIEAHSGKYKWRLTSSVKSDKVSIDQLLQQCQPFDLKCFGKAYRFDMTVENCQDEFQTCTMLSSTKATATQRQSRHDYQVCVTHNGRT